jgi:hypothetical protein
MALADILGRAADGPFRDLGHEPGIWVRNKNKQIRVMLIQNY